MNNDLKVRIKTFLWGMGGFLAVAVASYLINISDVREIDIWKLLTIVITVGAGYVVNGITKQIATK